LRTKGGGPQLLDVERKSCYIGREGYFWPLKKKKGQRGFKPRLQRGMKTTEAEMIYM